MKVVVIGGTGHIGSYLVPRLVESGYEVISVSRASREPYQKHSAWNKVKRVKLDREKEEADRTFADKISALGADIVVDLICFKLGSAQVLCEKLAGKIEHFLHCGTIWVHGHSLEVPTTEEQSRGPLEEYGRQKAAIEAYLLRKARIEFFPATIIHPGHIAGPGWAPLNPAGHFNTQVFMTLAKGQELVLPNFGMETVHHVHAGDVAQVFAKAIKNRNRAVGESFHAVSEKAITLRGYAEKIAEWFGAKANLKFMPFEQWKSTVPRQEADDTYSHISHSPNCSIEKASRLLDYRPRYSSLEAVYESVSWLIEQGVVKR